LKIYIEAINKNKERKYKKENDIQNQEEIILAERHLKYDNKDYKYYDKNKDMIIIFKTQTISKKVIFYHARKDQNVKEQLN
jgi:propanediol utilization protein